MVELGFGGSKAYGLNTGSDIRSIVSNATKDVNMNGSKTKTIMDKEELNKKKVNEQIEKNNKKVKVQPTPNVGNNKNNLNGGMSVSSNVKNDKINQNVNKIGGISGVGGGVGGISGVGDVKGIKVGEVNGNNLENKSLNSVGALSDDEKLINNRGRFKDLKRQVDIDSVVEDLYLDVGNGIKKGTLANASISDIKNAYSELSGLDDNVIIDLIADLGSLYEKGLPLNENNLEKLKKGYPELNSLSWGFANNGSENMYQAGGFRESMNNASAIDLNKYGKGGAVVEGVMNPLGEATTLLDMAAQQIPQVDGSKKVTGEPQLREALSKLSEEDIEKYYNRYNELVKQGKLKGYTTQVEGKNLISQMWNIIKGNTKQNSDAGFRNWLIDQVNYEVNGWKGEFWGAANELEGIGGPNTAKLISNIPASAVKTTTAILRAMTNPLDTAAGLYTLGKDAIVNINNGTFKDSIIGQRYGSWDAFAKAMEQDPVGVASDLMAVAEGGAGLVKMGTRLGKVGVKGAEWASYVAGAEKTANNLSKIAKKLDDFGKKSGKVKEDLNNMSNMYMDVFLYGKDGKGGLIRGLEEWGMNGNEFTQKMARYVAKTQQPVKTLKEEVGKTKEAGGISGRIAQKITGNATAEDKLFQSASPNINRLTKGIDYENKRKNMDIANKAIVEEGYTPKNTMERVEAHLKTLNKKWNEFTQKVKGKAETEISSDRLVKVLEEHIKETGKNVTENQRGDIRALEKEIQSLKKRGKLNMLDLEDYKENINADTRNKTQTAKSDIYIRGMKKLSQEIGNIQNEILSKAPDEVKNLKRVIGALLDTKDDVVKANVKNMKRKEGGGLVESYSRIQGVADVVGGTIRSLTKGGEGIAEVGKGIGKMVLGKALGKVKDVDWLTKEGFKGLKKKYGGESGGKGKGGKGLEGKGRFKKESKDNFSESEKERNYDDAQKLAYRKGKSTERSVELNKDSKIVKEVKKKAKNVGFVTKIVDNIVGALKKQGEKVGDNDVIHGYANLRDKILNLSKKPTDTTAQHELFHAIFDIVDKNSKKVLLEEGRKFLEEKLGRKIDDVAVEEWLAESFGVYMRDKLIKAGIIDRAKGIEGLKQRMEMLFQRSYEWLQNYNTDRYLINDFFNEMWGNEKGLNSKGELDLSYLWENKGIETKGNNKGLNEGIRLKKSGNLEKNNYTTNTEMGMKKASSPRGDSPLKRATQLTSKEVSSSNTANFFEKADNGGDYIEYNNGGKVEKIYKGSRKGGSMFDGYSEKLNKGLEGYKNNLLDVRDALNKEVGKGFNKVIGKTGHGKDITISKQGLKHIYEKHGNLDFNTLINAINDPTNQKQEIMGGRYRFEVILDDGDTLVVGLQPKEKLKGGKVKDVNSRFDADLYSITSVTKGKPRGAESLEVRLKKEGKGLEGKEINKQVGKIKFKRVWHGSPASFEKFDSGHMGEGEGAQAHGWGHYVAVDEKTGRSYAEMRDQYNLLLDGKKKDDFDKAYDKYGKSEDFVKGKIAEGLEWGWELEEAKHQVKLRFENYLKNIQGTETTLDGEKYIHSPSGLYPKDAREKTKKLYEGYIDVVDSITEKNMENQNVGKRNLYEVEIPDPVKKDTPTGSNYLEEDGKITEKELYKFRELLNKEYSGRGDRFMEGAIYDNVTNGKGLYKELSYMFGEKGASKKLEERGYDGIHYFGGRDGEAYVIFNDDATQIQNHIRYKKDSTGRDLSKGQQEYFKDSKVRDRNGNLVRVYHGTANGGFNVFNKSKVGYSTGDEGYFGAGFYFTNDKDLAESYKDKGWKSNTDISEVKEGYINITKMFDFDKLYTKEEYRNLLKELGIDEKKLPAYEHNGKYRLLSGYDKDAFINDRGDTDFYKKLNVDWDNMLYGKELSDILQKAGYDGTRGDSGIGVEYVIFDSNQFKNVDNLNPTKNEDIRYKKENTDKRKDSYKMGLNRKASNKLWEESINPKTGKRWTEEEINNAVKDFRDEVLGDKKKLEEIYKEYIKNDELGEDVRDVFDIKGYINPDAVRPIVNKMLSEKYGVSDNILASVNHPASSKIADGIRDMIYDKSIEKAKKGEKVVVSTISGGGGSGKSKGPKALIKNGYIKDGKVDITLDVQKGADDLKLLIDKARKEGVLDKYEFDIAYVYAPVEDASKGVGMRTANQNIRILGEKNRIGGKGKVGLGKVFDVGKLIKELNLSDEELNRIYKGRSLPMSVFEEGHKKSAGEKGLKGFVKMSEEMDNFNLIITKRNGKGVDVVNVKKGGEFLIGKEELNKLVDEINENKNGGINMDRVNEEMEKLYKEKKISKRQYMNLVGGIGLMLLLVGGEGSDE